MESAIGQLSSIVLTVTVKQIGDISMHILAFNNLLVGLQMGNNEELKS